VPLSSSLTRSVRWSAFKFRSLVKDILDSDKPLVATIALKGDGMIADIKKREDVKLFELKPDNRDSLLFEVFNDIMNL